MPFKIQKKFNTKNADTNKKIAYFGTTTSIKKVFCLYLNLLFV